MDTASLVAPASAFLTVVSVVLGVKYRQGLEKARLFAELLDDIIIAAEDDEVSEEEFQRVVATAKKNRRREVAVVASVTAGRVRDRVNLLSSDIPDAKVTEFILDAEAEVELETDLEAACITDLAAQYRLTHLMVYVYPRISSP